MPCELGIGGQIIGKAIQDVSGLQPRDLRTLWQQCGDAGDVAFHAKSNVRTLVKPSPLLVGDVYQRMLGITRIKGARSGKLKGDVVRKLMVQAQGEEVRYLVRSLDRNLRVRDGDMLCTRSDLIIDRRREARESGEWEVLMSRRPSSHRSLALRRSSTCRPS